MLQNHNMNYRVFSTLVCCLLILVGNYSSAQTPYDDFVPSTGIKPMLSLPSKIYRVNNVDTSSAVKYLLFEKGSNTLLYVGQNDNLIAAEILEAREIKWWSVDPKASKSPELTPYRFGFNNPIRYNDPDGQWEWDAVGNLSAHEGDNAGTLSTFLGANIQSSILFLIRGGYTPNNNGNFNLAAGQQISKNHLWIATNQETSTVVNNTTEATLHYFNGNGEPADVGDKTTNELITSTKFQEKHAKITSQHVEPSGYFSVDMTNKTFHIGNTGVDYSVTSNGNTSSVTYTLFTNTNKKSSIYSDGYWDPDFIDDWAGMQKPDELGPNLERFGGTPYPYLTRERTYFFKPVEEK